MTVTLSHLMSLFPSVCFSSIKEKEVKIHTALQSHVLCPHDKKDLTSMLFQEKNCTNFLIKTKLTIISFLGLFPVTCSPTSLSKKNLSIFNIQNTLMSKNRKQKRERQRNIVKAQTGKVILCLTLTFLLWTNLETKVFILNK